MTAWSNTWDRIRANQAKQAADKLAAQAPPVPEHLPPLPPGTRYGGVLDDYENRSEVRGHVFVQGEDRDWTSCFTWAGTKGCPPTREGVPDLAWHVAIPVNEQP